MPIVVINVPFVWIPVNYRMEFLAQWMGFGFVANNCTSIWCTNIPGILSHWSKNRNLKNPSHTGTLKIISQISKQRDAYCDRKILVIFFSFTSLAWTHRFDSRFQAQLLRDVNCVRIIATLSHINQPKTASQNNKWTIEINIESKLI